MKNYLTCTEAQLRDEMLEAGEDQAYIDTPEADQENKLLIAMIHAIGRFRFPQTWGDGLPKEWCKDEPGYLGSYEAMMERASAGGF